ncbi:MAG TPA: isochorismatase family protein, partial [Thermoleophilaceae bacterium]|nr:isochorismatase family protein [Thermoleophilaceae bacterium]
MSLIRREDSVLVVVDTQPGFLSDDAEAAATVERIAWLAGMAAQMEIPVVVVEEDPPAYGDTVEVIRERLPGDTPRVVKPTFGLAGCPEAVEAVRASGRPVAVLTGFETDVCVAQSALGLLDVGLRAVVVQDACFTTSAQAHRFGLERLVGTGVERSHAKGVAFEWMATVEEGRAV